MNLRERLVTAREKAGLSQAQLAKLLRVSPGTVAAWESAGKHAHGMRRTRMQEVAKVLGIDVTELVA